MTAGPITVTPNTPAWRAAQMLSIYKFGALPVVDGEMVVGIISVTDFLDCFAEAEAERALVGT
jgi:CBS domain-containing protein